MKLKFSNRQSILASVIAFYLIPVALFASYTMTLLPKNKSWLVLSIGLLLIAAFSMLFVIILYYWEQTFKRQSSQDPYVDNLSHTHASTPQLHVYENDYISELNDLRASLQGYQEQQAGLIDENQQLLSRANQIAQEYADYKIFSEEQLKQKNLQIQAFQRNIDEQQNEVKHQQDSMEQLHMKVRDLSYEIKTLLSINEREPAFISADAPFKAPHDQEEAPFPIERQVHNDIDASLLLKRCINTAQKLTGAYYYGNELSRYREFSPSHSAIDLRRLFDSLRMENEALIVVYSPKDQKLLFANGQTKSMLGWSPDKFVSDFLTLIQEGAQEWKRAVNQTPSQSDTPLKLLLKSKSGQDVFLQCHLGSIPTGLFRGYIIGVLFSATAAVPVTKS